MKYFTKTTSPEKFEEWKFKKKLTKADLLKKSKLNKNKTEIWKKFTGIKKSLSDVGKPLDAKTIFKNHLLEEQGFICCYCQQRIELDEKTTIEHFVSRKNDPTQMFYYENMFACCDGGQANRTKQEVIPKYCGHSKENDNIPVNPLNESCESHFFYSFNFDPDIPEVKIEGKTPEGKETIEKLNLDTPKLRRLRGDIVSDFIFDRIDNENYALISAEHINDLLPNFKHKKDKKFYPFCVVLESILKSL